MLEFILPCGTELVEAIFQNKRWVAFQKRLTVLLLLVALMPCCLDVFKKKIAKAIGLDDLVNIITSNYNP